MPSRNAIKEYSPESYYHVYARGTNKQKIFNEAADYRFFTSLFERYLSRKQAYAKNGSPYPHLWGRIELQAYCLMTNHFHILLHQKESNDLQAFMRSIMTSYSRFFNLKYKRTGPVFESRYKAVRIDTDNYLQHVTRYIHLNPRYWEKYYNSSLRFYKNGNEPEWFTTKNILGLFANREDYMKFVSDYNEMRDTLADLKYQLADH